MQRLFVSAISVTKPSPSRSPAAQHPVPADRTPQGEFSARFPAAATDSRPVCASRLTSSLGRFQNGGNRVLAVNLRYLRNKQLRLFFFSRLPTATAQQLNSEPVIVFNAFFALHFADNVVKLDILKNVPTIAAFAAKFGEQLPALDGVVSEHLLPMTVHNVSEADADVRRAAHSALLALMEQGYVSNLQAEVQVCPTVLAVSKMNSSECLVTAIIVSTFLVPSTRLITRQ